MEAEKIGDHNNLLNELRRFYYESAIHHALFHSYGPINQLVNYNFYMRNFILWLN